MNISIRKETTVDYKRVEEVARDAFWNLYIPGAEEHYLVNIMREDKDTIKELSYVIEVDGIVQGAIYYTHSKIIYKDGQELTTITFGPVFISPDFHRKGLGRKLITHTIALAKDMGYNAIVILGYPHHYKPYGFLGGKKYNISMPDGNFYIGLQILPLKDNIFNNISGYPVFSEIYEYDKSKIEAFDNTFPPKEKLTLDCQKEYEIACQTLDE